MKIGNMCFDSVAITDANGAVIAVLADDKCLTYGAVKIVGNPDYREDAEMDVVYAIYSEEQEFSPEALEEQEEPK